MDETNKLNLLTDAEGHSLSPVLESGIKNYLIDIDGTICDDVPNEDPERMKIVLPYVSILINLSLLTIEFFTPQQYTSKSSFKKLI